VRIHRDGTIASCLAPIRRYRAVVHTLASLAAIAALSAIGCAQAPDGPGPAPRELRAAWIATVDNIDWPSKKGLSVETQQAELRAILDAARGMRLNAVVFQVRPACDALYETALEPWSEWLCGAEGRAPEPRWDPLQSAIDGARARGLELHAWFNPFRARHAKAASPAAEQHVSRRAGWTVSYGGQLWLDPGVAEARAHSLRVMFDVVERYDVDGVHIDDYFYPYPVAKEPFPDDASFAAYRRGGGRLARDDWRRANVDGFVERLYAGIKARKPWVKFGISPFGIARPGVPKGIEAGIDQFAQLYADVLGWCANGWFDYLAPQLYWPIAQKVQSYPVLLRWWAGQNPHGRHLWIGNHSGLVGRRRDPWPVGEVLEQIRLTRAEPGVTGNIHFSMKALLSDTRRVASALRDGPYANLALVPASPWLDPEPPSAPQASAARADGGDLELRWSADPDARWRTVYLRGRGEWQLIEVVDAARPGIALTRVQCERLGVDAAAVASVDRAGNESARTIVSGW
jgi:uncharacterized lipoprotein YddW (UPF0748 family)